MGFVDYMNELALFVENELYFYSPHILRKNDLVAKVAFHMYQFPLLLCMSVLQNTCCNVPTGMEFLSKNVIIFGKSYDEFSCLRHYANSAKKFVKTSSR